MRTGLARFEYRHFIVFEDGASLYGAEVTECAADQGAFWEFHDRFLAPDRGMYQWQNVLAFAESLGLNLERLQACVANHEHLPALEAAQRAAWELGVRGTPTVAVNGVLLEEPSPANIIAAVEAATAE